MQPKVSIVLLNWNGWRDTIECLESVFHSDYENWQVIVCDNGSTDNSVEHILDWAAGSEIASVKSDAMATYSMPPVSKPIQVQYFAMPERSCADSNHCTDPVLVLIQNGGNLGFAAGCNVGLRYALTHGCDYAWLLNNDTVVSPNALSELVATAEKDRNLGMTGATIRRYYTPEAVQAYGGTGYNRWTARTQGTRGRCWNPHATTACILGCSMLVSQRFLNEVGLMDESYFLYFEELDWAARSKSNFSLGYAADSNVFHKEGASIGSSGDRSRRSLLSEHYLSRNRIIFTRRFYPWLVPSVTIWVLLAAVHRLMHGDVKRALEILKGALEGFRS